MAAVAQPEAGAPRSNATWAVWTTFGAVAVIKLILLAVYGPIFTPDTGGYAGYAELIRTSRAWLSDAGLAQGAVPVTAIRMIGYPAIIAAAMAIAGNAWALAVVLVQCALSLAASVALYRLALELRLPQPWALAAVLVVMTSMSLTYDQAILTDSLYTSLIIATIVALTRGAINREPLTMHQVAWAGVFVVLAFLLRDATQVLVIALLPLVAVRIWLQGRDRWRWSVACCLIVLTPLLVAGELYRTWNAYRTGERFVTTVAQITVMHGLAKVAASDPALFGGSTPLDKVGARLFRVDPFGETARANNELFAQGFRATDIARMAYAHYFRAWRDHPATMFRLFRRNTSERAAKLTVRPIGTICEIMEFARGAPQCPDYRDLYRAIPTAFKGLGWSAPVFFTAQTVELTAAISLFTLFLLGLPLLLLLRALRGRIGSQALIFAAFWAIYVAWYMAHAIVHVEDRYMAPVLPLSVLGGVLMLTELLRWRQRQAGTR